jgi:hypothetical protein
MSISYRDSDPGFFDLPVLRNDSIQSAAALHCLQIGIKIVDKSFPGVLAREHDAVAGPIHNLR